MYIYIFLAQGTAFSDERQSIYFWFLYIISDWSMLLFFILLTIYNLFRVNMSANMVENIALILFLFFLFYR